MKTILTMPSFGIRNFGWSLEFKKEDCWIGFFPRKTTAPPMRLELWYRFDVWVCLIPMFPIHFTWYRPLVEACEESES